MNSNDVGHEYNNSDFDGKTSHKLLPSTHNFDKSSSISFESSKTIARNGICELYNKFLLLIKHTILS